MTTSKNVLTMLIAALGTGSSLAALAADEPAKPAEAPAAAAPAEPAKPTGPSLSDVLGVSGIDMKGYVDAAFSYLSTKGQFSSGANSRVFDYEHDSFNLHQVGLTIAKQPKEGFGAVLNVTAGKDVKTIKSFDQSSDSFDITQGFIQYAGGPWTIIGGKFVTLAGAEVIDPTAGTNYSRSILFGYAIPFTHTGVRATYAANDQTSLIVGINNGWDQLKDMNSNKTVELGATFAPTKTMSFAATIYSGTEDVAQVAGVQSPGARANRTVVDLVATFNVTEADTIIANFDYGSQKDCTPGFCPTITAGKVDAKWNGLAAYWNHTISDQLRLSLRGEYFNDKDGYRTGVAQKWKEVTATLAYMPTKSVELRAELRGDFSDKSGFLKTDGSTTTKNQQSVGVEAIYKF